MGDGPNAPGEKTHRRAARHRCRVLRLLPALLVALVALAACAGSGPPPQTAQTARYTLQLSVEDARLGDAAATVEVRDPGGQPAQVDGVVIAPTMRSMGMASPEVTAQQVAPGRFRAEGITFSMLGDWELDVRVSAEGSEDTATFKLEVTE
jgi:hypothetical protein